MTEVNQSILRSVDAVREFLFSTPRRRHRDEAREEFTLAYVRLILAWCYVQLSDRDSGEKLIHVAKAALPIDDPVHQTVVRAFELRIAEDAGARTWSRFDLDTSSLTRFERYKVEWALAECAVLARVEDRNPIRGYQTDHWINDSSVSSILAADGDGAVNEVRRMFQEIEKDPPPAAALVPLIGPCRRAGLESNLMALVRRQLELADQELDRMSAHVALSVLGAMPLPPVADILERARVVELPREPRDPTLRPKEPSRSDAPTATEPRYRFEDRQLVRRIIAGYALSGRSDEAAELIAAAWSGCTDSRGQNSHFCVSVIGLAETIALSALGHELALGGASFRSGRS